MDLDKGSSPISSPQQGPAEYQPHVPRITTSFPGFEAQTSQPRIPPELEDNQGPQHGPAEYHPYFPGYDAQTNHPRISPELEDNPNANSSRSTHAAPYVQTSGEHLIRGPDRPDPTQLEDIVPLDREKKEPAQTIKVRLKPTLDNARSECKKFDRKAKMTGYALNVAIGLQVLFGALTTAVSAGTSGKSTSIGLPVIGGMATLVASYLARARGSNEPELSIIRVKDLEQFIRECEAFEMDYGHLANHDHDAKLDQFRRRFEELLGNGNGERRLATSSSV